VETASAQNAATATVDRFNSLEMGGATIDRFTSEVDGTIRLRLTTPSPDRLTISEITFYQALSCSISAAGRPWFERVVQQVATITPDFQGIASSDESAGPSIRFSIRLESGEIVIVAANFTTYVLHEIAKD
jgi:hypothetical protein